MTKITTSQWCIFTSKHPILQRMPFSHTTVLKYRQELQVYYKSLKEMNSLFIGHGSLHMLRKENTQVSLGVMFHQTLPSGTVLACGASPSPLTAPSSCLPLASAVPKGSQSNAVDHVADQSQTITILPQCLFVFNQESSSWEMKAIYFNCGATKSS